MVRIKVHLKRMSLVCLCVFFQGCQPPINQAKVEFRVPVTVTEVNAATVESRITTAGKLRAPEVVTLTVKTAGILQIAEGSDGILAEGDRVKAGDLIGVITGEDARLAVKREAVKQKLETARMNLESSEILFEKKLISVSQYGNVKDLLEDAKLAYQISLNTESQNNITSSIDGVILKLSRNNDGQRMANGQLVEPGQVVAEIAPLDSLIADIDLIGSDISVVKQGIEARIDSNIFGEKQFSGQVLRLAPTVDEITRTLQAEVKIDNTEMLLRPGMFVAVTLVVEKKENVPVIPFRSVTERGGQKVVFVAKGQRVEQRVVEVGIRQGEQVEILQGVNLGESVVVLGLETLTNQMPINIAGV